MRKKVLLTNFSITNYTGSELDTITMANYFLNIDYDVTIFTLEYGNPLLRNVKKKIKLIDYDNIDLLEKHYDLIWAHHYPLLDYLLLKKRVKADYIHYVSLSAYMGYEAFPAYYEDLNYVSILSEEAKEIVAKEGYNTKNINVFTNYSYKSYFDKSIPARKKLRKICIISNHLPNEMLDFKNIAQKNSLKVDIYGMGYNYKKVDDKLLLKYDLVISIGKTINYAISLGIPCYCYDHFGGDGYIKIDNIKKLYEYNFSGRYSNVKKTGSDLYKDIVDNYYQAQLQIEKIKEWGYQNFCYENMMDNVLRKIYSTKKINLDNIISKYSIDIRKSSLFVETVGNKNSIIKQYEYPLEYCTIYYNFGDGFSQKNSETKFYYKYRKSDNKYTVNFKIPKNVLEIRFDYTNKPFANLKMLKINNNKIDLKRMFNMKKYNDLYFSVNNDPYIILEKNILDSNKINISVEMEFLNSKDILEKILEENAAQKQEINLLKEQINNKKGRSLFFKRKK